MENIFKFCSLISNIIILILLTLGLFGVISYSITAVYAIALCGWASVFVGTYSEYF